MKKINEKNDDIAQILEEELNNAAADTLAEVGDSDTVGELSGEAKDRIKANINKKVETYESERVYAKLSTEDREALDLGRKVLVKRRKKNRKVYLGLTAVLVMVLAVGITSVGGPTKFLKRLTQQVGEREVAQVDSGEDIARSVQEKEKEAYQQIEEQFGINPVRIVYQPKGMQFQDFQIDELLQTIDFIYIYKDSIVLYNMSLDYTDSSWGIDMDDAPTEVWEEKVSGCPITMKAYVTPETKQERYNAQFVYNDVGYSLSATMDKEYFVNIIKNLHFL